MRKRAMKAPRPARQYTAPQLSPPQLTQPGPGETSAQILESLLQTSLSKLKAKTQAMEAEITERASANAEESETGAAAAATVAGASAEREPQAALAPRPLTPARRVTAREKIEMPEKPKRPRGRPRREPVVGARPEKAEKPKKTQRDVARCPACAIPLITDLNTGTQVCLTCEFQLAPQAASGT